ncbi:MAG TPA: hypothetical protein VN253_08480 [Kofleriaceae bacterium]|nr:hypothetical protein [Kofleriaceae bacterium]
MSAAFAVAACSSEEGGSTGPDAKVFMDAAVDAPPPPLMGLGQACSQGTASCPANAPLCILDPAGKGFCTKQCVMNSMFTTDAQGKPGAFNPSPSTQDAMCTPIYTGGIGTARCAAAYDLMPADPQLQPNKTYTIQWGCAIQCGAGNSCPAGLTCNTQVMLCNPA